MRSGDVGHDFGDDESLYSGATTHVVEDILSDGFFDYRCVPLTVDETLLEVELTVPGPEAIRLLDTLSDRRLDAGQALAVAAAWERQARWMSARQQSANVAFIDAGGRADRADEAPQQQDQAGQERAERERRRAEQSRIFELGLAVDCNDQLVKARLATSRALGTTLTATAGMLQAGELSEFRARRICEKLDGLEPAVARVIEARVLPTASTIRLSSLTNKLRRWVVGARGDDAVAEHLHGTTQRRVTVETQPSETGLLGVHAYLPPQTTIAVREALEAKAAQLATADRADRDRDTRAGTDPGPRRTKDQRLADALAWFILGPDTDNPAQPQRPTVVVQVTLSLPTLLHLQDHPGELPGYGPIPADIARLLAEDAHWQRFVHEPVTGHLLDIGDHTYTPPPAMRRFTKARDIHDRFPGSARSARHSDGDHIEPFHPGNGGRTASTNIAMLSRIGHTAKTHGGWTCEGDANNTLTWTSPHGHTHHTQPHDYRDQPEPHPEDPPDPPPF